MPNFTFSCLSYILNYQGLWVQWRFITDIENLLFDHVWLPISHTIMKYITVKNICLPHRNTTELLLSYPTYFMFLIQIYSSFRQKLAMKIKIPFFEKIIAKKKIQLLCEIWVVCIYQNISLERLAIRRGHGFDSVAANAISEFKNKW